MLIPPRVELSAYVTLSLVEASGQWTFVVRHLAFVIYGHHDVAEGFPGVSKSIKFCRTPRTIAFKLTPDNHPPLNRLTFSQISVSRSDPTPYSSPDPPFSHGPSTYNCFIDNQLVHHSLQHLLSTHPRPQLRQMILEDLIVIEDIDVIDGILSGRKQRTTRRRLAQFGLNMKKGVDGLDLRNPGI